MTNPALVSICIPAYNAQSTLAETLESILAQDAPHFEIIVSDNNSTDDTKKVVLRYADRNVRYQLIEGETLEWSVNMPTYIGAYVNANYALSLAHGHYLCLFHADDIYDSTIIRKQVALMEANPEVGAVFTMSQGIDELGRYIQPGTQTLPRQLRGRQVFDFKALFNAILRYGNFLRTPSVMLRRSAVKAVGGFNESDFLTSADLEMWLRIARKYEIGIINEPLLNYRQSDRQFGKQYNRFRTRLSDFFTVMDFYLTAEEGEALTDWKNLAIYHMERAADQVLCAMNLLVQENSHEATSQLRRALKTRHFMTAVRQPRKLARLGLGGVMLLATRLGAGPFLGKMIFSAYQKDLKRRKKPLPGHQPSI